MSFKEYLKEQPADEPTGVPVTSVDIKFVNLDELTQKKIIDAVMEDKNVDPNDDFANKKIVEGLTDKDSILAVLDGEDIANKINFDL